ncbi:hypothetical protein FPZ42_07705 [Mucilaginibacter achroorhodeus]|uniref:Uncharacterized protein n=1 Tax=Mucilaginibacter achroorhodeus TaxID=2599294 RepID=A0A563U6D5_9SPHI|nr:hypothetical protein [Mucilaginibacter achroorhodeus]TWR26911.1 hypothetical protein FPZ42_07705 [Mucilaginibacter achroorhodeus]
MENDIEAVQPKSLISELNKSLEDDFNKRWGWFEIAKNVADYTRETLFQTMQRNVAEVLTLATLLKEKVALIESKYKK